MQGAWAGEIGMVQMLPQDILDNGVDGDGDGLVDLRSSPADALMSGAKMLSNMGWKGGQPWLQEVILPFDMDWSLTGLDTQQPVSNWVALGFKGPTSRSIQPIWKAPLFYPKAGLDPPLSLIRIFMCISNGTKALYT